MIDVTAEAEKARLAALYAECLLDTPSDAMLDRITELASRIFSVPIALISLIDESRQWFKSKVGLTVAQTPREQAFCGHAIFASEPLVITDAREDPRFADNPLVTDAPGIRFYAGVPLRTKDGHALGTLCIIDTVPRPPLDSWQMDVLQGLASLVMGRIESLRSLGYIDPLTALPNRERFIDDLRGQGWPPPASAPQSVVAIDVGGVDYFRSMVKAFGWEYAEAYLVAARDRLLALIPERALYRIGITMYAYFPADTETSVLADAAGVVLNGFLAPITVDGVPNLADVAVCSVRVAELSNASDCVRAMMTTVDLARLNGSGYAVHAAQDYSVPRRVFEVLSALADALRHGDGLALVFQPKWDCRAAAPVGVEALLRWTHPVLGAVSPAEFIPLAERTALQRGITRWVVGRAVAQAAAWRAQGMDIPIALNVSATDFDQADFVEELIGCVQRHNVGPDAIMIEFTESALSRTPQQLRGQLLALRAHGFALAIDDFGTGYSSMEYLKRLPAQVLKIDQGFVRGLREDGIDMTIVPAMIQLGHALDMIVVAEGVEDAPTATLLAEFGCDQLQGFHIARPMPADELLAWWGDRGS